MFGCYGNRVTKLKTRPTRIERLRSEDTPRRPMITHTIDQFILNPKSILLTSSYRIPSQNKVKAEELEKIAENWNFRIMLYIQHATHPLMVVIICGKYGNNRSRTENVTERTDFQSQGRMTLKI